jgi:uncharacterized protein YdeI (YjbR/CyaY-like superfamily)
MTLTPTFFPTPADFRAWLEANHQTEKELLVGYFKKDSGKPSITWPESVDEALCYGWIDGVRRSLGETSYCIRFTPRKARSIWSAVNVRRMGELIAEGRVQPAGIKAFEQRTEDKTAIYAYEQRGAASLDAGQEALFRATPGAWEFFQAQPAGYRKTATWWVVSAKREETRRSRLDTLIQDSAAGRTIKQLTRPGSTTGSTTGSSTGSAASQDRK